MALSIPRLSTGSRLLLAGYGVVLLLWMSTEDQQTLPVMLLGTGLSLVGGSYWLRSHYGGQRVPARWVLPAVAVLGSLFGAGSVLCTVFLMFFKTALHAHLYPDFPPQMMLDMLARLPVWTVAGALLALAVLTLRRGLLR